MQNKECNCTHECSHNHGDGNCNHHSHEEHGCSCHGGGCDCGHEHAELGKTDLLVCTISVILFIVSVLLNNVVFSAILCTLAVILCGCKIFAVGIKALLKLRFDENTLIVIAALASIMLGEFHEAYFITILFTIGNLLENYAVGKSRKRIEDLIDLTSDITYNELGDKIEPQALKTGDRFLVKPGDKVCLDAEIVSGTTSFDTSNITGESIPRNLGPGEAVVSGYVNLSASVVCMATSDYANSTASKIKEYVANASNKKADTEKFITKFASIYTPAVIICALILGITLAVSGITDITDALKRALTFMIASCPCALVISIPLSYYASIGAIGKYGLLIKGSKYINAMAKADMIAFDKTGTITKGRLAVSEIVCASGTSKEAVLVLAKALEIHSSHPIAQAICNSCTGEYTEASDVKEYFGKGMEGTVDGHKIIIGTPLFCREMGCISDDVGAFSDSTGGIMLCSDGKCIAMIRITDEIKSDAAIAVKALRDIGIKSYMLSGDNDDEVDRICMQLGGITGKGNLLPQQKAEEITMLKKDSKAVIFVGDGVNDAPSLSEADFSVSIGSGSSLALESGDATLISSSLTAIPRAIKKARYTMQVIYSNIALALIFKMIVLVLAAVGIAPIWLAVLADVGILIITVMNSLSVFYRK